LQSESSGYKSTAAANINLRYRSTTLRSRIIPLTSAFLEYLREDGLWLPDDTPYKETPWSSQNSDKLEDPEWESDTKPNDASKFLDVHEKIQETIAELGGSVVPKLNWSAPKDALHMALSKNSMECKSANDIYLLLKSSIFITHDLEHAFDDCVDSSPKTISTADISYTLILRPFFKINTAFEFRCFVKDRIIIGVSQRDLKYIGYSDQLLAQLQTTIQGFFDNKLKRTFPDSNFAFDVYLPEPHDRVRLIDINPWAPRTDPLLFSWLELLTLKIPGPYIGFPEPSSTPPIPISASDDDTSDDAIEELPFKPEFRIIHKDDPEAYNFGTAPYSAHKLPKEVVDASSAGGGAMRELMEQWERLMRGEELEEEESDEDDIEEGQGR
jgi:D123